jgi:hypothetical protein
MFARCLLSVAKLTRFSSVGARALHVKASKASITVRSSLFIAYMVALLGT